MAITAAIKRLRVIVLLSLMVAVPALAHEYTEFIGKVVGVLSGDTIQLMHEVLNVRLAGVDCPEDKQPYGEKAKQFTSGLAWRYRLYDPDSLLLKTLETEARLAKRGLWADKKPRPL